MKGLLKGLRYISQIFDEEKDQEMQIGFPTDVKHVAHIGWDGPTVDSPSWMKEFNSSTGFQSAPLGPPPPTNSRDGSEIKWVSEDSKRGQKATSSPGRDLPELPKSARRQSSTATDTNNDSPRKKDSYTKSRQSIKNQPKENSSDGGAKSGQPPLESTSSPPRNLPDIPRRSRRKKSKESDSSGGSTRSRSRSKCATSNGTESVYSDPGPGPDTSTMAIKPRSRLSPVPSLDDEENEIRGVSKE
ncbi:hypothetical protein DH2020_020779 [Rehmannia glutinosa]|uniref:CRIB domain-containing protein n=1 Tax=Rehmannia glutinosa TaxID=99300 RepID=A0ABR0WCY8_REHGL